MPMKDIEYRLKQINDKMEAEENEYNIETQADILPITQK